jgi:hypothetical protein
MSEPITWAAVATWLVILKGKREKGKGKGQRPGTAQVCVERGEKIAVMKNRQDNLEEDVKEIKQDVKDIKQAVTQK